jgi:hypothetical protein
VTGAAGNAAKGIGAMFPSHRERQAQDASRTPHSDVHVSLVLVVKGDSPWFVVPLDNICCNL